MDAFNGLLGSFQDITVGQKKNVRASTQIDAFNGLLGSFQDITVGQKKNVRASNQIDAFNGLLGSFQNIINKNPNSNDDTVPVKPSSIEIDTSFSSRNKVSENEDADNADEDIDDDEKRKEKEKQKKKNDKMETWNKDYCIKKQVHPNQSIIENESKCNSARPNLLYKTSVEMDEITGRVRLNDKNKTNNESDIIVDDDVIFQLYSNADNNSVSKLNVSKDSKQERNQRIQETKNQK
jgi:hypothetical protein